MLCELLLLRLRANDNDLAVVPSVTLVDCADVLMAVTCVQAVVWLRVVREQHVVAWTPFQTVRPVSADKRVVPSPALYDVGAIPTLDRVVAGTSAESVAAVSADDDVVPAEPTDGVALVGAYKDVVAIGSDNGVRVVKAYLGDFVCKRRTGYQEVQDCESSCPGERKRSTQGWTGLAFQSHLPFVPVDLQMETPVLVCASDLTPCSTLRDGHRHGYVDDVRSRHRTRKQREARKEARSAHLKLIKESPQPKMQRVPPWRPPCSSSSSPR